MCLFFMLYGLLFMYVTQLRNIDKYLRNRSFIIILHHINKLVILADGMRMPRVLFMVKSEWM